MGKITVHAGDFEKNGNNSFGFGIFTLFTKEHPFMGENISASQLEAIDIASEENVKKIGGTAGWGLVGGVLLGPVGLLAGLLAGGRKKDVTFIAKFKDGRKLLATTNQKTYTKIQAAVF